VTWRYEVLAEAAERRPDRARTPIGPPPET
jgi:hypothetical protein